VRGTFIKTLTDLAEHDPRIVLLTGDLGFTVVEPFRDRFPERFYNVGVAEQNMIGVATGLAESGFRPFAYSIATFATMRPYEFIRNGPINQQLPVRVVGVGGGFEYGPNGPTHFALEDIALMRAQPGMTVIAPADYAQARTALLATSEVEGPIYFRLGKDDVSTIPGLDGRFELGRAELIGEGDDVLIIATGSVAREARSALETLSSHGVKGSLLVVGCVNPAPVDDLVDALTRFTIALSVEAHYVSGGLGSLVSEVVAENRLPCRLVRCAVKAHVGGVSGSERFMHEVHGLTAESICASALQSLRDRFAEAEL
jgi:transketolase